MNTCAGTLVLVVGPSGAGKDTLLAGAQVALADDQRTVFTRRVVTRASGDGIELHQAMTEREFSLAEQAGQFLLSWHAHQTFYAIPVHYKDDLARDRVVVANVSRTVIDAAYRCASRVAIIRVTVPDAVRAARLHSRRREDEHDIARRLARDIPISSRDGAIIDIVNDSTVEAGVQSLTSTLRRLAISP